MAALRSQPDPGMSAARNLRVVEHRGAPRIELRLAEATDADVVSRLAELDSAPKLTGEVVIALVDGDPVAGVSLRDRRVVANPFVPTEEAVALIQLRAEHLSGPRERHRLRPSRRRLS